MYCVNIKQQSLLHILLTSLGGYILVMCSLINALHWIFIVSPFDNLIVYGFIFGSIATVFIIFPLTFEVIFIYSGSGAGLIHFIELLYASVLNVIVTVVAFVAWAVLRQRLRSYTALPTISKLRRRLTVQMLLYILFFLLRAGFMLAAGLLGYSEKYAGSGVRYTFFFVSGVAGDVPLALVMLHFLQSKRSSASSYAALPVSAPPVTYEYPSTEDTPQYMEESTLSAGFYLYQAPTDPLLVSTPTSEYMGMYGDPEPNTNAPHSTNSYYLPDDNYV